MVMLTLLVWGLHFENQLSKKKGSVFQKRGFDLIRLDMFPTGSP